MSEHTLLVLFILALIVWLFVNHAPVNNGQAYFNGGPYLGNVVTVVLAIIVIVFIARALGMVF